MPGASPRGSIAARLFAVQLLCILLIGAAAVAALAIDARGRAGDEAAQRSLVVARTVADNPFVLEATREADPSSVLQPYAEEIMADTGVDFLTIMDPDRTRYTHRDRDQIGKPFIGTIEPALEGRTFTETYTGTLGPSVRAVAPIESADGTVVALVSAGVTLTAVDASFASRVQYVAWGVLVAVALGGFGSWLLARYLRRVTGGRGPEQMSQVFAYYESVLHSVREGLLLVDDRGRLVLANDHALELLGLEGVRTPVPVAELDIPEALRELLEADEPIADRLVVAHERILVVNERPAASPGARPLGTVTTLRDRTELQRVSGELESMRTLSDALRSQTHEFSNRLHTIASLIELGRPQEALAFAAGELNLSQRLADRVLGSVQEPVIAALLLGKAAQARERAAAHEPQQRLLDRRLRLRVERARRLVEQQDPRIPHQGAGDGDALALAAREAGAALPHDRVDASRQLAHELEGVGVAEGREDPLLAHSREAVGDVVADRALEEHRLLRHDRDRAAPGAQVESLGVDPVEEDAAAGRAEEAQHEVEHRRLARARRSDERDGLPRLDVEGDVAHADAVGSVLVGHVLEADPPAHLAGARLALVRLQVRVLEQLADRAHRLRAACDDGQQHQEVGHRAGQEREVRAEQHDLPGGDRQPAADRHPGGEDQAGDAQQLEAHPRQRGETAVQQVEGVPGRAHALGAPRHPLDGGLLEPVGAGDRDERGHLTDACREVLDLAPELLVAPTRALAEERAQHHRERDRAGVDGKEGGHLDRRHHDRSDRDHRRREQRVRDLLEHRLDVLDIAHDLGLHDRRARSGVEPDREVLQPGGEGVAQVGARLPHGAHVEPGVHHVVRVVLQQRDQGDAGPEPQGRLRTAGDDDVDDRAGDHGQQPERGVLHGEEHDGDDDPRAVPAEEAQRRASGPAAVDHERRLRGAGFSHEVVGSDPGCPSAAPSERTGGDDVDATRAAPGGQAFSELGFTRPRSAGASRRPLTREDADGRRNSWAAPSPPGRNHRHRRCRAPPRRRPASSR